MWARELDSEAINPLAPLNSSRYKGVVSPRPRAQRTLSPCPRQWAGSFWHGGAMDRDDGSLHETGFVRAERGDELGHVLRRPVPPPGPGGPVAEGVERLDERELRDVARGHRVDRDPV